MKMMTANIRVYLDTNATTPLAPEVVDIINKTMVEAWGNPSSAYPSGAKARAVIDEARCNVAQMISANPKDIIFMSGGTEANNTVLNTILVGCKSPSSSSTNERASQSNGISPRQPRPHFITTNLEHDSVANVLQMYSDNDLAEVTIIEANVTTGCVDVSDIMAAVLPATRLISVMLANNETGVIQPVGEISRAVKQLRRGPDDPRLLVHTDAAQALGKVVVDVDQLGVDYLTIVGHKFYGPRIGALFVRDLGGTTPLTPMFFGGRQERGLRSGTENTAMIAGLGRASELVRDNIHEYGAHMAGVRDYLEQRLQERFGSEVCINARYPGSTRLPNTTSMAFRHPRAHGRAVLSQCRVVEASVGAACHSHEGVSSILLASGVPQDLARNSIRLSVGRDTTLRDIDLAIDDLDAALKRVSVTESTVF